MIATQLLCWFVTHCMTSPIYPDLCALSRVKKRLGNSSCFLLTHSCTRLHHLSSAMSHAWKTIQTEEYKPSLSRGRVAPSLPCAHHALSMVLTDRKHNKQPSIYRRCLSLLHCSWSITWLRFLSERNPTFESYFGKNQLRWEHKKGDWKEDVGVSVCLISRPNLWLPLAVWWGVCVFVCEGEGA